MTYQYDIPFSAYWCGGKYATDEEKKIKRDTVTRFIKEAKAGNVYKLGGIGTPEDSTLKIVAYNRSKNGLGLKCGRGNTLILSRENVLAYIKNGATLIATAES